MAEPHALSQMGDLLERPRVTRLLQEASRHHLVTVIAAPGYGKTQSVAAFARSWQGRLAWLRLCEADNAPAIFWQHFSAALSVDFPGLCSARFPATPKARDGFLQRLADASAAGPRTLLVCDDYHHMAGGPARALMLAILQKGLPGLCIMLLSDQRANFNTASLRMGSSLYQVDGEDLRFTHDETAAFLAQEGLHLPWEESEALLQETDGWPAAIYQYARRRRAKPEAPVQAHLVLAHEYFENEAFCAYPPPLRRLLVQLALLPYFSVGIVGHLCPGQAEEWLAVLGIHPFIRFDHRENLFYFQGMYHRFLKEKRELLPPEERRASHLAAAGWFAENGRLVQAAQAHAEAGDHDGVLRTAEAYWLQSAPPPGPARPDDAMLACLAALPEAYRAAHPRAGLLCAGLHWRAGREADARRACQALLAGHPPPGGHTAAEAHVLLASLALRAGSMECTAHAQRAAACLPPGGLCRLAQSGFLGNCDAFFLPGDGPGIAAETAQQMLALGPALAAAGEGLGQGVEWLFAAEAAFHTGDLARADTLAHKAVSLAGSRHQSDIVANANLLLLRIAMGMGRYTETQGLLTALRFAADREASPAVAAVLESAEGWYALYTRDEGRMEALRTGAGAPADDRGLLLQAAAMIMRGSYAQALQVSERWVAAHGGALRWTTRLSLHVLMAVAYQRLGEHRAALEELFATQEMTRHSGAWMLLAEQGNALRSLLETAPRQDSRFDEAWCGTVHRSCLSFAKRRASLASRHNSAHRIAPAEKPPLTRREQTVLEMLSQGLTREEIAGGLHITVNGVKKHITTIYNKLGAVNRADAIRIAGETGYLP